MNQHTITPDFWIEKWNDYNRHSKSGVGFKNPEIWNQAAAGYRRNEDNILQRQEREKQLCSELVNKGILKPAIKILDVGCGPGTFAIPFAEHGAYVTAIDISTAMIQRLEQEMPKKYSDKINASVVDWENLDLKNAGFENKFDLVFAHMTPATNLPTQFLKLLDASKNWCFFSAWVGERDDRPLNELWKHVTGEQRDHSNFHFYYTFNLLFTMGYFPEIQFYEASWERSMPVNQLIDYYVKFFSKCQIESKESLVTKISTYLHSVAVDGMVQRGNKGIIGQMLWQVK